MSIGRNDPCPCGSGQKAKRCCLGAGTLTGYSRADRTSARTKLEGYVTRLLGEEDDSALDDFWSPLDDLEDDLEPLAAQMSEQLCDDWFMFDRPLATGERVIERFLKAEGPRLGRGERAHLDALATSTLRLYEIEDLSPGETLTLKDVLEGTRVTVQERQGSRGLRRFDWVAARVVIPGASGKPELEGVVEITRPYREGLRAEVLARRTAHLATAGAQLEDFYRALPPLFHEVWAGSILAPAIPQLRNTDDEELVQTRVQFEVLDRSALLAALASSPFEAQGGEAWGWSQANPAGQRVSLGTLQLRASGLAVNTNANEAKGARSSAPRTSNSVFDSMKARASSTQKALRRSNSKFASVVVHPLTGVSRTSRCTSRSSLSESSSKGSALGLRRWSATRVSASPRPGTVAQTRSKASGGGCAESSSPSPS